MRSSGSPVRDIHYPSNGLASRYVPVKIRSNDVDIKSTGLLAYIASLPFIHHHVAAKPDVQVGYAEADRVREVLKINITKTSCFVFLDDLRDPPPGATLCRTAHQAIRLIESGVVARISFDHDLGTELTGYDVAKLVERLVAEGKIAMPRWHVHSANPVGRSNIEAAMRSAERFAKGPLHDE